MSKITLEPNASGAGTFSIVSPDSNTNRTLTLPDEEGTVATIENIPPGYEDQDALDLFNVTGSAPVFACRAWVNFDGTDSTIRSSGNVSSITEVSDGYLINFATNMPDNKYSVSGVAEGRFTSTATVGLDDGLGIGPEEVDRFAIRTRSNSGNDVQRPRTVCIMVVR